MGRASKMDKEINMDACLQDGCDIYQRHGGGCSVVLDPGNVIVSLTLPLKGIGNNGKYFRIISSWLIEAMDKMGFSGLKHDGYSDLVLKGRKVAGSCIYRTKDVLYYSVSILSDPDISLIHRYLKHPPREPEYRKGRQHRDFVLSMAIDAEQMIEELKNILDIKDLYANIQTSGGKNGHKDKGNSEEKRLDGTYDQL